MNRTWTPTTRRAGAIDSKPEGLGGGHIKSNSVKKIALNGGEKSGGGGWAHRSPGGGGEGLPRRDGSSNFSDEKDSAGAQWGRHHFKGVKVNRERAIKYWI